MVKALIDQGRNLAPVRLLPTLVSCVDESQERDVITYLEFCVDTLKCTEKAIHNLLVSLYAKYDPDKLMKYLEAQGREIVMVGIYLFIYLFKMDSGKILIMCLI